MFLCLNFAFCSISCYMAQLIKKENNESVALNNEKIT